jgi:hypothetical protein
MPVSFTHLEHATREFFRLHWTLTESPPKWSQESWCGIGPIPSHDRPGCYALLQGDSVLYIGSAVGRGSARYKDFGLSLRVGRYLSRDRDVRRDDGLPVYAFRYDYTALHTIGFPRDMAYLVIALEYFLIGRFPELINKKRVAAPSDVKDLTRRCS